MIHDGFELTAWKDFMRGDKYQNVVPGTHQYLMIAEAMGCAQVYLPGYVEDIAVSYWAADIFIFPSKREGMPMSLMEAMAAGLPVVASKIRGNEELVDSKGGRLVRADDAQGFANAAAELIEILKFRPDLAEGMGRYNQNKIKNYDIANVSKKMKEIYAEVLQ